LDHTPRTETGKLLHLALPVRWSLLAQQGRPAELACTYDIHSRGARLLSARQVSVGDLVMIERGRHKTVCQVVWTADPASSLRGQFSVRCVEEGRTPWDEELRQMEEQYQPVIFDGLTGNGPHGNGRLGRGRAFIRGESNRRRSPRFEVEGHAEAMDGVQRVHGELQQISEFGARIAARESLGPGTDFRLTLNMLDVSLALKAQVKYLVANLGMGVEFQEIRRGDRPLLSYVLSKLKMSRLEEFCPVEVVTEPLAAAG
jgi:hypothetical protein